MTRSVDDLAADAQTRALDYLRSDDYPEGWITPDEITDAAAPDLLLVRDVVRLVALVGTLTRERDIYLHLSQLNRSERSEAAESRLAHLEEGLRLIGAFSERLEGRHTGFVHIRRMADALLPDQDGTADCEHDYVFVHGGFSSYRCDKCGRVSGDGVHPRIGGAA